MYMNGRPSDTCSMKGQRERKNDEMDRMGRKKEQVPDYEGKEHQSLC